MKQTDSTGLKLIEITLPDLLLAQAHARPSATAIDSYDGRLSYGELWEEVDKTTRQLREMGIRPGNRVGLCSQLSSRAVISILAIMTIGGSVIPVDPLHPVARRLTMLREAGVFTILLDDNDEDVSWTKPDFQALAFSKLAVGNKGCLYKSQAPLGQPHDIAFVAFTSGSTGKPKGICQTHQGIATMSIALAERLHVTSSSRVAQFHPYIFDVSMMEICICLATGATLCIAKRKDMMLPGPKEVGEQLTAYGITHVTLSPTMLNTMEPDDVPTLQVLSVMGEPLGQRAIQKWAHRSAPLFYQLWGCTEGTILQSITSAISSSQDPQNVGKAIQGACRLWITDPTNVDCLIEDGAPGELIVESRVLATGYLGRHEETERAFLSTVPWKLSGSMASFYRTGDLAQKHADGSITFLGRLDGQMNYHGERIELGEIDYYLNQLLPGHIYDCFSDFDASTQTVVGFFAGGRTRMHSSNASTCLMKWDESAVSKSCLIALTAKISANGDLPDYMVPHIWLPIRSRPLTISGKTDRASLRRLIEKLSPAQWREYSVQFEHNGI